MYSLQKAHAGDAVVDAVYTVFPTAKRLLTTEMAGLEISIWRQYRQCEEMGVIGVCMKGFICGQ